ncbi:MULTISPECIES: hypothetical protein [Bradyrhizobium]|jgi:hypothetical protein|uniref:Uncharacterized protein n=2 Tax=Bradyrhizobium TaxID=374 RepID=A0A810CXP2_9BRAD|nr:hypothetical protein [Bradyrhizobium elkanii]BCE22160.1 hypothetical protein XF1B_48410 [Bradyrhizobium diazoefficiens]WLA44067.1 hypothetical protein QNJ95_22600 [Bradyrhizobium elkanii]BCE48425.1 hypothetical protein XF4B_47740 [Bradyrhizobium diazoefficiens]BCE91941.1 hypothetical protein XF10B_47390 [Bradyrhizobium diazoefficiens]BCF26869.1 hypothetical protein XF14B_48210 [Bradyrhizobium diazoefficiens]
MPAAKRKKASPGSQQPFERYGLKKISLIPETSAEDAPAPSPEKKSVPKSPAEPRPDPISTSPFALQAYELIKVLDPLVGVAEATFFMNRSNEMLGGITPVTAIKQGRLDDVKRAVRAVAAEKGVFQTPL